MHADINLSTENQQKNHNEPLKWGKTNGFKRQNKHCILILLTKHYNLYSSNNDSFHIFCNLLKKYYLPHTD